MKQVASTVLRALVQPVAPSGARLFLFCILILDLAAMFILMPHMIGWPEAAAATFALYLLAADVHSTTRELRAYRRRQGS